MVSHFPSARIRPVAAALMLSSLALLPTGARAQEVERRTIPAGDAAIYNLAGVLRVEGTTGTDLTVEVKRGGRDGSKLQLETGPINGIQTLRVIYPDDDIVYPQLGRWSNTRLHVRDDGTFGDSHWLGGHSVKISGRGDGIEASADLVVKVPKGRRVAVHLAVGEAHIYNVDGDLVVDVSSASLTSEKTTGKLKLDTGWGDVHVTDAEGDLDFDTGSGDVTVARLKGTKLRIDAGSGEFTGSDINVRDLDLDLGSGGARLSNVRAGGIKLDSGSGNVDLDLRSDVDDVLIDSGSGDVTIHIPDALGAELDIDTGSGGVDSEIPITLTHRSKDHLTGRIGDGRGRIRIDSGSGEVRLVRAATSAEKP
jgi:lia operon protein LiaG